jgi:ParB-like chromosome segregation protein Spo0J
MALAAARSAFERQVVLLPLADMLVLRQVDGITKRSRRYRRIAQSIDEIGLVEPLAVCNKPDHGRYLLLDGHLRRAALLDKGETEAR